MMDEELRIICWPDPRLKKVSTAVEQFDDDLEKLTRRMLELMRLSKGVGLAAPQVGLNLRLFVINATGKPEDDRIYVNPELSDLAGDAQAEEGCLSIPGVHIDVTRATTATIKAFDLQGRPFEQRQSDYVARIWQHEQDHLNGILLTDRMGPLARMTHRRTLKELEEKFSERK